MTPNEAKQLLNDEEGSEDPICLPPGILNDIAVEDVPEGLHIQIGVPKDGIIHVEWSGTLTRESKKLVGHPDYTWTRKYWYYSGPRKLDHSVSY